MYSNEEYKTNKYLKELEEPKLKSRAETADFGILLLDLCVAAVFALGAYFWQWLYGKCGDGVLDMLLGWGINIMSKIFWCICIFCIIVGIVEMMQDIFRAGEVKESNDKERQRVKGNKEIIQKTKQEWESRRKYLQKEYNRVIELQNTYYKENILAMQYRNLPALIYIYQYMSTSRADLEVVLMHTHLEEGIQRIERKLDEIIRQNESVIFSQHIAEAQNNAIMTQNKNMLNSLGRIENNAEETAYYSRIAVNYARTAEYFQTARYLEGR